MKFKKIVVMLAGILLSASCSGNQKQEIKNNQTMEKGKILIVFFSHAGENYNVGYVTVGNTKLVANEIQKLTGGDMFEVVAEKNYDMPYNDLIKVAKEEAQKGEKPALKSEAKNIEQYDTIFIGGPIWWGTYPQVMFTFFDKYDLNGKTIVPFTTHEGSGLANCVEDIRKAYPNAKVLDGFAIYGHEARKSMAKVDEWLKRLGY
ncbi:MAG TPA: flavodoxin [Prevotella sp.]